MQSAEFSLLGWVKSIGRSWTGSLAVFKPTELKNFLLLALKALKENYKVIFGACLMIFVSATCWEKFYPRSFFWALVYSFCFCVFLLALRSSSELKTARYYASKLISWSTLTLAIAFGISGLLFMWMIVNSNVVIFFLAIPIVMLDLMVFFVYDAQETFKEQFMALARSLIMFVYNYPFFFLTFAIVYIFNYCFNILVTITFRNSVVELVLRQLFFYMIVFPVYSALITNFYIKRIHEQFSLYYR